MQTLWMLLLIAIANNDSPLYPRVNDAVVHAEPSPEAKIIGRVRKGTPLLADRSEGDGPTDWIKIRALRGEREWDGGWIRKADLLSPQETPEGLMRRADDLSKTDLRAALSLYRRVVREFPRALDITGEFSISKEVRAKASTVRCRLTRRSRQAASAPEAYLRPIAKAVEAGRRRVLVKLADCDFQWTACDSDADFQKGSPHKLIRRVLQYRTKTDWSKPPRLESPSEKYRRACYPYRSGSFESCLQLRRAGRGWRWTMFCTTE
jgi:hypothetical protein